MTATPGERGTTVEDRWGRDTEGHPENGFFAAAYRSWFRVEWEGLEHVPEEGGALLVWNHAGMMPVDGGIIQHGIQVEKRRAVYMLAHHGFFRIPFMGRTLNRIGSVVAHPDNAHRLLAEDDRLVLVFPEGAKGPVKPASERYRLQRFGRGGFVETAMRAGVPIVPIVLMGTEDTTPTMSTLTLNNQTMPITWNSLMLGPLLGSVAHLPVKIRARVLPPIQVDGSPESRSLLMDRAEHVRSEMQTALDDLYRKRRSLWEG
ncbi:MAG: acyltransferase family protein [bacterium]|nr:acyltransferase family protein [bacterium]